MKLTDLKHDHSLTNLLKVIIFSILMLTPFFYVATKSLYVVCNKNAYESYYGETINQQTNTFETTLKQGKEYNYINTFNTYVANVSNTSTRINVENVKILENSTVITFDPTAVTQIGWYLPQGTVLYTYFFDNAGNQLANISTLQGTIKLNLVYLNVSLNYQNSFDLLISNNNLFYTIEYNQYSYLDNAFEYSVNQMAQSQLFTWTQNTGVYTGANAMTTGLGLTSPVIPILISYWFLLTIIYVVIDIVIVCFTTITHMIVKKSN